MKTIAVSRREEAPWCDFAFVVAGERITLHQAILAARSPFFCRMLLSDWRPQVGSSLPHILCAKHKHRLGVSGLWLRRRKSVKGPVVLRTVVNVIPHVYHSFSLFGWIMRERKDLCIPITSASAEQGAACAHLIILSVILYHVLCTTVLPGILQILCSKQAHWCRSQRAGPTAWCISGVLSCQL